MSNVELLAGIIICILKVIGWITIAGIIFYVGMSIYYHFHERVSQRRDA